MTQLVTHPVTHPVTHLVETQGLYRFQEQDGEKVAILRGVDLAVGEREFVCVMGPSGSGKTTLLHLLSGLDEPSAGKVLLGGQDLAELSVEQRTLRRRKAIGYVFQFFNLLPNLSVIENVGLPLSIAGGHPERERARIDALHLSLGLASRAEALPHQLSGGEMQRTSIARALVGGQKLLLADEPTGNLSQKAGLEVMQLLRHAVDEDQRSVLLVTHNPRDACFADRVLFLVDGEIVKEPVLTGPGLKVEDVHAALAQLAI